MPGLADASLLTLLGLGPDEDAVHRLLVDRPDSDPAALSVLRRLGRDRGPGAG
ncbi:hypothetical protein ACFWVU_06360 [Streptomyces sp. NPDC058686]|uniref:hypothetical protein n=1 Tax=Streptomyces sp. NPDC058686 TaxID=3346599 RepID=UPI00365E5794